VRFSQHESHSNWLHRLVAFIVRMRSNFNAYLPFCTSSKGIRMRIIFAKRTLTSKRVSFGDNDCKMPKGMTATNGIHLHAKAVVAGSFTLHLEKWNRGS
jgi:hypothetical protein